MAEYRIVNYDIVGGEVNEARYTSFYVDLDADYSIKDLKRKLYRAGFCNRGIFNANLFIEESVPERSTIYISTETRRKGLVPFCELRPIFFREKAVDK